MITNKVSIYGDSVSTGDYATRFVQRSGGKIVACDNYARGGNSFADNLIGKDNLFGGLTFQQHISQVDDADIVLLRLGGNSVPEGWVDNDLQATLGVDYLQIAAECLMHAQYARSAGKRPVLVGTPYTNLWTFCNYYGLTEAQGVTQLQKTRNVNTAIRCVAGMLQLPFIATHGSGGDGLHPVPNAACVWDGIHPTPAYSADTGDYLADCIVRIFKL